jgi:hypothetical protein
VGADRRSAEKRRTQLPCLTLPPPGAVDNEKAAQRPFERCSRPEHS